MSPSRPNILILMTDQQRADCLGCAGHPVLKTPHMDRLAREGTRFSHFCTVSPICMPARAGFISGLYPHTHGMWHNAGQLPEHEESLFTRLRAAGYRTCHIGKSHYYEHRRHPNFPAEAQHLRDHEPYMHARGFDDVHETTGPWSTTCTDSYMTDHWRDLGLLEAYRDDYEERGSHRGVAVWPSPLPEDQFADSYVGRRAVEYLEGYSHDQPFCLFVGFGGPHEPWDPPGRYATMYDPALCPAPIRPNGPGPWVPLDVADAFVAGTNPGLTDEVIARVRAAYYGKITLIDRWFGEILGVLQRQRRLDDTLVVFWSDHGEMAGDHGRLHKSVFHESALRVPLILRWPGRIPSGETRQELASTVDLFPTVLQAAGVEVGDRHQGQSLWTLFEDRDAEFRTAALSEVAPAPWGHLCVRTRHWKYAMTRQGRGMMLYNLETDPDEHTNLIGHPEFRGAEMEMRDRMLVLLAGG